MEKSNLINIQQHDEMVGSVSELLALRYGFSEKSARQLRMAAALHDIGKSTIPKGILEKPGKLTDDEFDIMRLHTVHGHILLKKLTGPYADMARKIAMYHHERFDGLGYWGMAGAIQPDYVKIATIADVFTALINKRPYKPAWTINDAVRYIRNNEGSQFDPELVELFMVSVQNNDFQAWTGGNAND